MNLITSILNKDEEAVRRNLEITEDISNLIGTCTPLWAAITGGTKKPTKQDETKPHYRIIKLLLEKKADPNKKCIGMTSLYAAAFMNRPDVVRLLLMNGADPNGVSLLYIHKIEGDQTGQLCAFTETALTHAIEENYDDVVDVLILYGSLFNKVTMDKAKRKLKTLENDASFLQEYKKLKRIIKIMELKYDADTERMTQEWLEKNKKIAVYNNYFFWLNPEDLYPVPRGG